ncbi:MAG: hypothetical protein ACK4ZU_04020 [Allorhizobium sp.]
MIEFYALQGPQSPLGFDAVDAGVLLADVAQVMANWYVNIRTQYENNIHCHEDDFAEAVDEATEAAELLMTGCFVVRDSRGNVVDRVTSDVVRDSDEIQTADPLWVQRRDPDFVRREAEAAERRIKMMEAVASRADDDDPIPF